MRTFSLRRRLPPSSKVFLGLAAGCALAAFALVHAQGARAAGQGRGDVTVQVVVAAHDLAAGIALVEDDVQMQAVPEAGEPPGALTSVDAATGRVPTGRIAAGEVLTITRVATSLLSGSVPFGDVAVTVTFASVPDGLTVADRVDAYATFGGARPFTTLAGEDLRVLRIGASDGAGLGQDRGTRITLDVDAATARQLVEADATGSLALVVRGAGVVTASPSPSPSPEVQPTEPPG